MSRGGCRDSAGRTRRRPGLIPAPRSPPRNFSSAASEGYRSPGYNQVAPRVRLRSACSVPEDHLRNGGNQDVLPKAAKRPAGVAPWVDRAGRRPLRPGIAVAAQQLRQPERPAPRCRAPSPCSSVPRCAPPGRAAARSPLGAGCSGRARRPPPERRGTPESPRRARAPRVRGRGCTTALTGGGKHDAYPVEYRWHRVGQPLDPGHPVHEIRNPFVPRWFRGRRFDAFRLDAGRRSNL